MRTRHLGFCAITAVLANLAGCGSSAPATAAAETAVRASIDDGRDGRLKLNSFKRTDGRAGELMGVKVYEIMFTAEAEFVTNAMFSLGMPFIATGSRVAITDFREPSQGFSWADFGAGAAGYHRAMKGDRLGLTGTVSFEKRESGWYPLGLSYAFTLDSASRARVERVEPAQVERLEPAPTPQASDDLSPDEKRLVTAMKSDLRNLVSSQESYFSDNARYTSRLRDLNFRASAGVSDAVIVALPTSWSATNRHASLRGMVCGIAVNTLNPVRREAGEGEPVCVRR